MVARRHARNGSVAPTRPSGKIAWSGTIVSVQPRIRLTRSFDQRHHSYLGYTLRVRGLLGIETREFLVAAGTGTHAKHQFRVGDRVGSEGVAVADSRIETADLYKVSKIKILVRAVAHTGVPPPWHGVPKPLDDYRARGHRRLDARTYGAKCGSCLWGCRMAVEMIIDQWNPDRRRYRVETFCYGPLSCPWYKAGPTRKVPGRRGMSYEEEDWVDTEQTSHRTPDE